MTSRSRGIWVVILMLLTPAVVLPLVVGLDDRVEPRLAGFPFFFWFQLALILFSCAVTGIAYVLSTRADRLDRLEREERG